MNEVNAKKTRLILPSKGLSATGVRPDSKSSWLGRSIWFVHVINMKLKTDILLPSKAKNVPV